MNRRSSLSCTFRKSEDVIKAYDPIVAVGLTPDEEFCLDLVPKFKRKAVLDLGIGSGRTMAPLSAMFENYVGIDYSEKAIAKARTRFPNADVRVMDARAITFVKQFDCIIFPFNGIDYVGFDDRKLILRRVKLALSPGGTFIYSTHNLGNTRVSNWSKNFFVPELFSCRETMLYSIRRRLTYFWRQSQDNENHIAYINDPALSFAILTTYVDIPKEIERLQSFGFTLMATIGNTKKTAGYNTDDSWVYIVAKNS